MDKRTEAQAEQSTVGEPTKQGRMERSIHASLAWFNRQNMIVKTILVAGFVGAGLASSISQRGQSTSQQSTDTQNGVSNSRPSTTSPSVAANLAKLPPQIVIDSWKADENKVPLVIEGRGHSDVISTTIDKIEYGSHLESQEGKGIPAGTVLYLLRMHISQEVPNGVEMFAGLRGGGNNAPPPLQYPPGVEHEIVDAYFYQDVFGKWLYYSDSPQNVDFVQTGPTPALVTKQ
jgi:hypothetical protein